MLSSNVATLVTISLPLSSLWAGVTLHKSSSGSGTTSATATGSDSSRRNLWNKLSFPIWDSRNTTTLSSTPTIKQTATCYADNTPAKQAQQQQHNADELGIAVEHDISVHSYKRERDMV